MFRLYVDIVMFLTKHRALPIQCRALWMKCRITCKADFLFIVDNVLCNKKKGSFDGMYGAFH